MSDLMTTMPVLDALRSRVSGPVLTPEDDGYAEAVDGFDLAVRHRPPVAVVAATVADVAATLSTAAAHGLPVTVVGGGHGDLPQVDAGVWLTTRRLRAVSVDAAARTARIQSGATWHEVIAVTAPLGLAPVCGSAPAVGVGGYLLGGGLGPLARSLGFSSDRVRSGEVVLADGTVVTASPDEHPELYWALRGGKGGFGVVTAMTVDLVEVTSLYGGGEYYPAADIRPLWEAYARFTAGDVPAELTTSLAILRLPDLPVLPPPLRGRLVTQLRVAHLGSAEAAEQLLAPLRRATGQPILGGLTELPYERIGSIHSDPTQPSGHATGGTVLERFDAGTVEALLAVAGADVQAPLAIVEVRHLGGAIHTAPQGGDAVSGRDAAFGLWVSGAPLSDAADEQALAASSDVVRGVLAAVAEWSSGAVQINFCGSVNTAEEARRAWPAEVAGRLEEIRRRYDPARVFRYSPGSRLS